MKGTAKAVKGKGMKAKFIGYCGYDKYDRYHSPIYEYEYRGHRYFVTDFRNGYTETMADQHHYEQNRIDEIIKCENMPKRENEETSEGAMDYFFKMLGEL